MVLHKALYMKILGTVTGMTAGMHAVVMCAETPSIGDEVLDGKHRRVGRVYRIFGPVDAPYASVTLDGDSKLKAGTELYFNGANPNGKTKRRN